jgi:hypothetical protein
VIKSPARQSAIFNIGRRHTSTKHYGIRVIADAGQFWNSGHVDQGPRLGEPQVEHRTE